MFLRYLSSELNRWYFEAWEKAQLGLAAAVAALLYFALPRNRMAIALCLAMTLIVAVERFALTPEIVRLGRLIDFVSPEVTVSERTTFWRYHHWYSVLEVTKMLLGAALTAILLRRDPRDR